MAVALDTANKQTGGAVAGANPGPNVTCGAGDNLLLVILGCDQNTAAAPPTAVTYGGTAMTYVADLSYTNNYRGNLSLYRLNNPTTGSSLPIVITTANTEAAAVVAAIPVSGVNLTAPLGAVTFNHGNGTSASVTSASGVTADINVGALWVRSTGITSTGTNQSSIVNVVNGGDVLSVDSIPGANTPAFAWTLTASGDWIAFGVAVKSSNLIAGGASDVTSATGAISTAIQMAAAATSAVTGAAALMAQSGGYASVTLTNPLYSGVGSVLDPNFWQLSQSNPPVAGDTLYYDGSLITIAPNGEIFSTSNNCSALVQFNDGTGLAQGLIVIVPTLVGYLLDVTSATGVLATAVQLAAAATSLTSGAGSLATVIQAAGGGADVISATGALSTAITAAATALETTSATGNLTGVAAALAGSASDATTVSAALNSHISMASAALDLVTALAALTTRIQLAGSGLDTVSASGKILGLSAALLAGGADTITALAALTTHVTLTGAARTLSNASASLSTQIMVLGAALDTTSGTGDLTTNASPAGLYPIDPAYVIPGHRDYATPRFPSKGPAEDRILTFNFGDDLENGEVLTGIIVVSIVCSAGTDTNAAAMLNGMPAFSQDLTQICQPIMGGLDNSDYYITVTARTTNPNKILSRYGLLPVRA